MGTLDTMTEDIYFFLEKKCSRNRINVKSSLRLREKNETWLIYYVGLSNRIKQAPLRSTLVDMPCPHSEPDRTLSTSVASEIRKSTEKEKKFKKRKVL